jgi:hypothetical protein
MSQRIWIQLSLYSFVFSFYQIIVILFFSVHKCWKHIKIHTSIVQI